MQAYSVQKNKLLPLKRMHQMCLQNVRGFVHRSIWILAVLMSKPRSLHKTWRKSLKLYLIDNQRVLKSQVLLREPLELVRDLQEVLRNLQPLLRKLHKLVRETQLLKVLKKSLLREPQERDMLKKLLVRERKLRKRKKQ